MLGLPIPEAINRYLYKARKAVVEAAEAVAAAAAANVDNDVEMFEYDQQPADHAV